MRSLVMVAVLLVALACTTVLANTFIKDEQFATAEGKLSEILTLRRKI